MAVEMCSQFCSIPYQKQRKENYRRENQDEEKLSIHHDHHVHLVTLFIQRLKKKRKHLGWKTKKLSKTDYKTNSVTVEQQQQIFKTEN